MNIRSLNSLTEQLGLNRILTDKAGGFLEITIKDRLGNFIRERRRLLIFMFALFFSGAVMYALYSTYAATGTGVAYDWETGESLNDFVPVSSMPEGWDFVTFGSFLEDGSYETFGIWVPIGEPMIASRDIKIGDQGDDVKALQTTLNYIRTEDTKDNFYFNKLNVTGVYDSETQIAIKKMQDFFGLEVTGVADLNTQSSIYEQATSPEE